MSRIILWIRANVLRMRHEREMRQEMTAHMERATEQLVRRGLPPDKARIQAERDFGNVEFLKTEGRDARGTLWLDSVLADTRFALRQYARKRGTAFMMFIVLAFGMSLSTLLFSVLFSYAKQAPPGVEAEDLVRIRGIQDDRVYGRYARRFSEAEFHAQSALPQFTDVVGQIDNPVSFLPAVDEANGARQGTVTFVTGNYFRTLGVKPVLGGDLHASAERSTIAVLTHAAWKKYFGMSTDIVGSTISINGIAVTITGVAPPSFNGVRGKPDMHVWEPIAWMPLSAKALISPDIEPRYTMVARLRDGVSRVAATAAVRAVASNSMTPEEISTDARADADIVPLLTLNLSPAFEDDLRYLTVFIGVIAGLVLLVTCTNVSALLTGLASARRHEIAVRLSLGASRGRLIRQLLTESAALAVIAGCAALAVAYASFTLVMSMLPYMSLPLGISWPATAYTFGIALVVGVLFGLSPALHATRMALSNVLRDSGGAIASSRSRLQRSLVAAQIAFTQPIILVLTAVIVGFALDMQTTAQSDAADRIIMVSVNTPGYTEYGASPALVRQQRERLRSVAEKAAAMPGVRHVALESAAAISDIIEVADRTAPGKPIKLMPWGAAPEYFDVMGLPIVAGRTFRPSEAMDSASRLTRIPVIVGADLALKLWGSGDPLGRMLEPLDSALARRELIVVGVIDDPVAGNRKPEEPYQLYLPPDTTHAQDMVMVHTATAATPLLPQLRTTVREAAPGAVIGLRTVLQENADDQREMRMMVGGVLGAGTIAMLLSALGLYAVISFAVGQRTQEIAVRMSLGARSVQIANVFLGEGVRLGGIGMLIGLPVGILALVTVRTQMNLEDMSIVPVTLVAMTGVLLVAALSAWVPARRAAAVNPAESLRNG